MLTDNDEYVCKVSKIFLTEYNNIINVLLSEALVLPLVVSNIRKFKPTYGATP